MLLPPDNPFAATMGAFQAGQAYVLHAMVNCILAAQQLTNEERIAFFKVMRGVLEDGVTNTKGIQDALRAAGIEDSLNSQAIEFFRTPLQMELKLIDKELGELTED